MEYMNNGNISTLLKKIIRSAEAINDSIPFTAEGFFIAANGFNAFELEESEKEEYEVFLRILNGKTFCDDLSCKFLLKYMHSDEYIPNEHIEYMQSKLEKAKKVVASGNGTYCCEIVDAATLLLCVLEEPPFVLRRIIMPYAQCEAEQMLIFGVRYSIENGVAGDEFKDFSFTSSEKPENVSDDSDG